MTGIDQRTEALVRLAASLTGDEESQLGPMDAAAQLDPAGAEEVMLQSYLFLGFPVALNSLGLWRRRTERPAPEPSDEDVRLWLARGEQVCRAVYAHQYPALREVMAAVHPDLDHWALLEGYGKVLGRPGLDLKTRELCVVAMLAGSGATRQLHAHLRGCLNVGASAGEVEAVLERIGDLVSPARAQVAWRVWQRVRERWESRRG